MAGPPVAASAPVASFEDDWEEYDPKSGLTFTDHMIAGSCAGLMEHVVMYPVDTLKVRVCMIAADLTRGAWRGPSIADRVQVGAAGLCRRTCKPAGISEEASRRTVAKFGPRSDSALCAP